MKTLKQLQVEHVANILLAAMNEKVSEMEFIIKDIIDSNYPFCKGRKMLKEGIERYCIISNRLYDLCIKYPTYESYKYNINDIENLGKRFSIVRDFYYNTNK
jgi:hypothetical protein